MRTTLTGLALVCGAIGCSNSSPAGGNEAGVTTGLTPCMPVGAPAGGIAHYVIDPADQKCKLDGTTTHIGEPCTTQTAPTACGTDQNAACLDESIDQYPGGYCNVDPCTAEPGHLCPIGASCVSLNGENPQCFKNCSADSDCRMGYICLDMTMDDHDGGIWTSGTSHKVCTKTPPLCPASPHDCPASLPNCVLPDGGVAFPDGSSAGGTEAGAGDDGGGAGAVTIVPICTK